MLGDEMGAGAASEAKQVPALGGGQPGGFRADAGGGDGRRAASTHPVKGAKRGPKPKLALEDRLLMLLRYYREYRTFAHIAASFGISETQCRRIVTTLEARLLADERFHLARKQALRGDTRWQGVVVDVGECACERPKKSGAPATRARRSATPRRRRCSWSGAPGASWPCARARGGGTTSTSTSKAEPACAPSVPVFCDTGYQGLQKLHANTRKPIKATKKLPLTPEQKRANRAINSRRVVVGHAIRRLKVFRLLGERYRNRRRRFGLRLNLIAAITNLEL